MRDKLMANIPPNSTSPDPLPPKAAAGGATATAMLWYDSYELGYIKSILLSILLHFAAVAFLWLFFLILGFLGINLLTFDRPERMKDIEFQLVTAPEARPRDPNTRNRAERNTRAGGEKVPNMREAESHRQAGNPQPQPKPQPQTASKPAQRQQPVVQQQRPQQQPPKPVAQQPQQEQRPAPPKPRATAPQQSEAPRRISAVPNPLAPIKTPDSPGPVADTGPLVRGPTVPGTGGDGSGGGSSVGPATVPGQFSGGGQPSAGGGPAGQGGKGPYSQYGSPGGGGGRPGIDALAEPDFGPYLAELQRRIRRNWHPPEDREDKTVVLMFTIMKDGRLGSVTVKRSSGFSTADSAARAAVEQSAPFRPLPQEYRHSSINVEFTFDYNVYTGRSGGISRR
jgi:TonB family protein